MERHANGQPIDAKMFEEVAHDQQIGATLAKQRHYQAKRFFDGWRPTQAPKRRPRRRAALDTKR